MRHRNAGRKLGRTSAHRTALLRNLVTSLLDHERIETTDAKAKELRRVAERMITRARRLGPLAYAPLDKMSIADRARRQAVKQQVGKFLRRFAVIQENGEPKKVDLIEKLFLDLAKRYADRPGGYTRIIKLGRRRGDNAPMAIVELLSGPGAADEGATEKKAPKKATPKKAAKTEEAAVEQAG